MDETADIAIVGAGPAGASFAWGLEGSGLRVVCLERGGRVDHRNGPALGATWELALQGPFHANPNIRRNAWDYPVEDAGTPIKPAIFNGLGGSTIRWGAHWPRFRPSDFRVRTLDGAGRDWPISYADLAPFYDAADDLTGVAGLAGDPANPCREAGRTPPLPLDPGTERLARGFAALGWHWWPSDAAILTEPREGRDACNLCGPCGLGCPRHARASADVALWPHVHGTDLRLQATVTGLEIARGRVSALRWVDRDGQAHRLSAGTVVLAANGIGSVGLMLGSGADFGPTLGRGLMLHPTAIVTGAFAEDLGAWRGPFACAFYSQEFAETDPARGFARGFQLQALRGQGPLTTAMGGYGARLPWGAGHHGAFRGAFGRQVGLTVTCEDLPEDENRVDLTDRTDHLGMPVPRMAYRLGANTRAMRAFGIERAREALAVAGAGQIAVTPLSRQAGFHLMGTARMGPGGVVDADCRTHGVENLLVVDASVFASSAPVNPTPTVMAVALRAAARLRTRLGLGERRAA